MENPCRKLLKHNGKTVILHDYRNLEGPDYVKAVEFNGEQGKNLDLPERLVLIDVTDSVVDKEVLKAFKRVSRNAASKVSKTAVVGVTGIQKLFIRTISTFSNLDVKSFDTQEDAKNWLTNNVPITAHRPGAAPYPP